MNAKDKPVADQIIQTVPMFGGPYDGGVDDGLISDGELCGKLYFIETDTDHVHTYALSYNHDEGYKFLYEGVANYREDEEGNPIVGEE